MLAPPGKDLVVVTMANRLPHLVECQKELLGKRPRTV